MTKTVPESAGRYTSKPATITAAQWDGTEEHARELTKWADSYRGRGSACFIDSQGPLQLYGTTLERPARIVIGLRNSSSDWPAGDAHLYAGDWLIKGIEDEFYPCPDSVFQRKYAPARAGNATEARIPADMLASIEKNYENVRLMQGNISIESVRPASWWTEDALEPPAFVVTSIVEVYADRIGMTKRRAPEPHILIQGGEDVRG